MTLGRDPDWYERTRNERRVRRWVELSTDFPLAKAWLLLPVVAVGALWLLDPGNRAFAVLAAVVVVALVMGFVIGRLPAGLGIRLNLAFGALIPIGVVVYMVSVGPWWAALIFALLILPTAGIRLAAIVVSFWHPEWLEDEGPVEA